MAASRLLEHDRLKSHAWRRTFGSLHLLCGTSTMTLSQADQTFCIGPLAVRAALRDAFLRGTSVVFAVESGMPLRRMAVVAKPSEVTPATATRFAELSGEADFLRV